MTPEKIEAPITRQETIQDIRECIAFQAAFEPRGDKWEVTLVESGESKDHRYIVTRESLENALHLFANCYIQELEFKDGRMSHLPKEHEPNAPGGVFGNSVGITSDPVLKDLGDGRVAVIAEVDVFDSKFREKMLTLSKLKKRLPGLSFNAIASKVAEKVIEGGRKIIEILNFSSVDSIEVVSFPNAGGAFRKVLADVPAEESPSLLLAQDRIVPFMKDQLIKYFSARGIPVTEDYESPAILVKAAIESQEFKGIQVVDQNIVLALNDALQKDDQEVAERLVAAIIALPEQQEPVDVPVAKPDVAAPDDSKAKADNAAGQKFMQHTEEAMQRMLAEYEGKLKQSETEYTQKVADRERVQAAQALVEGSTLPKAMKPVVLEHIQASGKDPQIVIDEYIKVVAPMQESGRVTGAVGNTIAVGPNGQDKCKVGLMRMLGAVPSDDEKKAWVDTPAFRSIGHAFSEVTGLNAHYLTLEEFNNPQRVKADIDMFQVSLWPNLLGETMNRTVIDMFNAHPHKWQDFVMRRTGCRDFRALRMNRVGGFGVPLPTYTDTGVGQTDKYSGGITTWAAPDGDLEGSFNVEIKAANLQFTYKMLRDDDVSQVSFWLKNFASACDDSVLYDVLQQFINASSGTPNAGTINMDSKALYHADHSNIITDAFGYEAVRTACNMIRMQVDSLGGGRPLNLQPFGILVPESLRDEVEVLTGTPDRPWSGDNDINTMRWLQPTIVHDFWLSNSATNWYVYADPKKCAALELAFLDDKDTPTILSQQDPVSGWQFSHLRTTFSGIYVYGCGTRAWEPVVGSFPV